MLDTRHITEHFTVMSGNTVSGLTINNPFQLPLSSFQPTQYRQETPQTISKQIQQPQVIPEANISLQSLQASQAKNRIRLDHQNAFLRSPRQRRQACSQRNRLRLTGRCGELRTDSGLPEFWALEPKGA